MAAYRDSLFTVLWNCSDIVSICKLMIVLQKFMNCYSVATSYELWQPRSTFKFLTRLQISNTIRCGMVFQTEDVPNVNFCSHDKLYGHSNFSFHFYCGKWGKIINSLNHGQYEWNSNFFFTLSKKFGEHETVIFSNSSWNIN